MAIYSDDILDEEVKEIDLQKDDLTNRIGIYLAKWSFSVGTLLFILGMIFQNNDGLLILGFSFTIITFTVNLMFFLFLCFKPGTQEEQKSYRKTAGIMILNLPIALIYLKIISPYL